MHDPERIQHLQHARERFIENVDRLLPLIEYGGWEQLKDRNTQELFHELARYAMCLGFEHPPLSFRVTGRKNRQPYINTCGYIQADCREVLKVTVNRPHMPGVAIEELSDYNSAFCADPFDESGCLPSHCVVYHALIDWRDEVEAIPVETQEASEESSKMEPPKNGTCYTRGINARRAYELVNEDGMTLKQAGETLAKEIERKRPFSPAAVSNAVKRNVAALADIGVSEKARSAALKAAYQVRDDDAE